MRSWLWLPAAAWFAVSLACDSGEDGPPPVTTCVALCDRTPELTSGQDTCLRTYLTGLGYAIDTTLQCLGFTSPAGCRICYDMLGPIDAECEAAWSACPP